MADDSREDSQDWLRLLDGYLEVLEGYPERDHATAAPTLVEIIIQPLFENSLIRNNQGFMLGMTKKGNLRNWAQKGFRKTIDIWDVDTRTWNTSRELNRVLKSPKTESQRTEVTSSIPWNLGDIPQQIQVGEWLADVSVLPPPRIVHIHSIREGQLWGWSYFTWPDSDSIHKLEDEPRLISDRALTWARVTTRFGPRVRISDFNPKENPPDDSAIWAVGRKGISDLQWDPKEWR